MGDDIPQRLREAASSLLFTEGPAALSVRRIAEAAGTTTMAVYSRYGGKAGLLEALCREGFAELDARLSAVPASGDAEEFERLAEAYRAFAHAFPGHYALMFGRFLPSLDTQLEAQATFDGLAERFARLELSIEPARAAHALLGLCHGLLHLEGLGMEVTEPAPTYALAVRALLSGFGGA